MDKRYQILFDYGSEGMRLYDDKEFDTVDQAVRFAVGLSYGTKFLIVMVHWAPWIEKSSSVK